MVPAWQCSCLVKPHTYCTRQVKGRSNGTLYAASCYACKRCPTWDHRLGSTASPVHLLPVSTVVRLCLVWFTALVLWPRNHGTPPTLVPLVLAEHCSPVSWTCQQSQNQSVFFFFCAKRRLGQNLHQTHTLEWNIFGRKLQHSASHKTKGTHFLVCRVGASHNSSLLAL